ncbi:MAG: hypothetical protein KIG75_08870, partial [Bacteroidales bacterium]|nr:hypothetical protein [Bacteroidales bacterium]
YSFKSVIFVVESHAAGQPRDSDGSNLRRKKEHEGEKDYYDGSGRDADGVRPGIFTEQQQDREKD